MNLNSHFYYDIQFLLIMLTLYVNLTLKAKTYYLWTRKRTLSNYSSSDATPIV